MPSAAPPPSTLTEWLRGRSDAQLAELLFRRPDLALPTPADLPTLGSRLTVRTSVQRAVDGLAEFDLRVLEALVLAAQPSARPPADDAVDRPAGDQPATLEAVAAWLGDLDDAEIAPAIDTLMTLGLVWGSLNQLRVAASVRDAVGPYPAGLGRPAAQLLAPASDVQLAAVLRTLGLPPAGQPRAGAAIAGVLADPAQLAALLAGCDDDEHEVLDRLAAGPPVGVVRDRPGDDAGEASAPSRLVGRGLLVALDPRTVELPREVGLAVRAVAVGPVESVPPAIPVVARDPAELDRIGTTAVLETLRLASALGESWTRQPAQQLRAGGVGTRELRRTARELGVDEPVAGLLIEVLYAAGLLNSSRTIAPTYLPTPEFDDWAAGPPGPRWSTLASAWLRMSRLPSLVGQRGDRERVITALSPDAERGTVAALRTQVLATLTDIPAGAAPESRDAVLRRLSWQAPRRAAGQLPIFEAILLEADQLGLTAAGGLTGYTRTLLAGSRAVAEQVLTSALPAPVDYFLVQPDLTVVVPGPPTAELAVELALTADLESSGGASVYRMTESSIRRALDAGRAGADIATLIASRSRTPVPQALSYLIDDLARRHGALRAGAAGSYLRCEDEALLARVLVERELAPLQLRGIAATVLVSPLPASQVLDALRAAGFAPAAEAPGGDVIALAAETPRAPSRAPVRAVQSRPATEPGPELADLVRRLRSGDALRELRHRTHPIAQHIPGVTSAATMGLLRDAIRSGRRVLLGCAEPDGQASRHVILPISMAGGFVRGHEESELGLRSFPLHRLTDVAFIDDDEDDDPA
jgi:hypothetical protein